MGAPYIYDISRLRVNVVQPVNFLLGNFQIVFNLWRDVGTYGNHEPK